MDFIPLTRPFLPTIAALSMFSAAESGALSGNGEYSQRVRRQLQGLTGALFASLTTSCSHALELACALVRENTTDSERNEIIVPSFTFTATANAVINSGASIVFADSDPNTMNISPEDAAKKITSKTAAIIPVHYAGIAADMDELRKLAGQDIYIIEDAAQALGAYWKDRHLGSIGDMGCISFHETKNITCGEGGAFLTSRSDIAEQSEIYIEKGTNRAQFLRGSVDKYTWVSRGSSYVLAEPLAAILESSLAFAKEVGDRRKYLFSRYMDNFKEFAESGALRLPVAPEYAAPNGHLFYIILPNAGERNDMMRYLRERNIGAAFHYVPLHSSPMGLSLGFKHEDCPVAEEYSGRLLRLPLFMQMTEDQQDYIIEAVASKLRRFQTI